MLKTELTLGLTVSRREVHAPEHFGEARVGAEVVPDGVHAEVDERREPFLDRLTEPRERLIPVAEARVDDGREVWRDVAPPRTLPQLLQNLLRLLPLPPRGVTLTQPGQHLAVVRRERDRRLELVYGRGEVALLFECAAEQEVCAREVRVHVNGLAQLRDGLVGASREAVNLAGVGRDGERDRVKLLRAFDLGRRLRRAPEGNQTVGVAVVGRGVGRV